MICKIRSMNERTGQAAYGETAKGSALVKTRPSRAQTCIKLLPCTLTRALKSAFGEAGKLVE